METNFQNQKSERNKNNSLEHNVHINPKNMKTYAVRS